MSTRAGRGVRRLVAQLVVLSATAAGAPNAAASEPAPTGRDPASTETTARAPKPAGPPSPTQAEAAAVDDVPSPPRIDGPYVGAILFSGVTLARVGDLRTEGGFAAFGGSLRFGEMVLPWLGLGLQVGGSAAVRSQDAARQTLGQGLLAVDLSFVPVPKRVPLTLRASFGFGGGAVREAGVPDRAGFGGAMFGAAVRYEWFPWAKARRPYKGGGFALGPELGWIGFTPAAPGRPMSNTIYLALALTFYFGA